MKKFLKTLLLVGIVAACSTPEKESLKEYSIEQFMDVDQIFGSSFSPDDSKILLNSKQSGVYNGYSIDLETLERTQLTASEDDAQFARSYFPEDERFIFTGDQGGNELDHIFIKNTDGSELDLTPDSAKATLYGWNNDRTAIHWTSNKRDPKYFDLYRTGVDGPSSAEGGFQTEVMYTNTNGFTPSAISDNERYIALSEFITTANSNIHILDTETGETLLITPHEGDESNSPQFFDKENGKLYYTTDRDKEFSYLVSYSLENGVLETIETAEWDIMYSYLSRTGKYRVTAINNDARTQMKIYDNQTGEQISIPGLPAGDVTSVNISDSERLMSMYISSSKFPSNLFLFNFENKELKQLTNTMNPEINPEHLVEGQVIRFASFDGLEISSLLFTPKGAKPGDDLPALLYIHGGPGGQTRLNYNPRIQYWVNHGYVILAVNNRGSSGYGKSFFTADDLKHGDVDLRDCIESKDFLKKTGYVDPNKIGIMGGSYGGYMVMAALAFAPEEFTMGVNYFGVTNWLRTLQSIPPWWESFREALYKELGNPATDSVALYNKSPLFHADKITKPFIVLQGANDPRVLQVESDEIVEAAKANGVPVEYVIFPDEGHGFVKKENNITASKKALEFMDKYLKGAEND